MHHQVVQGPKSKEEEDTEDFWWYMDNCYDDDWLWYFLTIIYNDAAAADGDADADDGDDDDDDPDNDDIWTITNMSYVSRHWTTNLEETL